jgi:hypothetical protein
MNPSYPEHWFRKVKKFTVKDDLDRETGTASTVVTIHYKNWWIFPRKQTFIQPAMEHVSVESCQRHPEAQVLIERLKQATGYSLS